MGAEAYGEAGAEPGAPESVERRAAREEPEQQPEPQGYPDDDEIDDTVQEHEAPIPAEVAAVHAIDESLGAQAGGRGDREVRDRPRGRTLTLPPGRANLSR